MNTPKTESESKVVIQSSSRWDTAFEGEVTDISIDGTSLKMTHHLHGKIAENGQKIAENGLLNEQNWKNYRDQHRKTRRLLNCGIALGLTCFTALLGFWIYWATTAVSAEETRRAIDQIDAIHKKISP